MNPRVTACAFLRCKNDTYDDPFSEDAAWESVMPRAWWCGKTFKDVGPDGEEVEILACQPGRSCHCTSVAGYQPTILSQNSE